MQIISYNPQDKSCFIGAEKEEMSRMAVRFTNAPTKHGREKNGAVSAVYGLGKPYSYYFVLSGDLRSATFVSPDYPISSVWGGLSPWKPIAVRKTAKHEKNL